jgi:hypothetical protein|uniref:Uncharacterized protein n=1 Tax=Mus musculus TaxID=10090 RepID=Q6R5E5_MOUSE|nr:unknown [Mus musculus]
MHNEGILTVLNYIKSVNYTSRACSIENMQEMIILHFYINTVHFKNSPSKKNIQML